MFVMSFAAKKVSISAALLAGLGSPWAAAAQEPTPDPPPDQALEKPAEPSWEALPTELPAQSDRVVDYQLEISLAEDGRTLSGSVTATWNNQTAGTTGELWWHVYNNAWSSRDSVWLKEARFHEDHRLPRQWGRTEIEIVELLAADDTASELAWAWDGPGGDQDRTVMRVDLDQAVGPGENVRVRVRFNAVLPPAYRRSGADGEGGYVHATQWFPKLGVFERKGDEWNWNCRPYHYLAEFYSNYGTYTLRLTLPDRYADKIAATGSQQGEPEVGSGTLTYTFYAEDVHDFAWTADPDFLKEVRAFNPEEWRDPEEEQRVARALGRTLSEIQPKPTTMILMLQPEHEEYREEYFDALAKSVYYFSLWYGTYPYETISLIDPANNARRTGGMEYPRLITGGVSKGNAARNLSPESVTVHEFGHQYWYGLVGNDEFLHAWLDEGLCSHSQNRILRRGWQRSLSTYSVLKSQHYGHALIEPPSYLPGDRRGMLTLNRLELPATPLTPAVSLELRRRTDVERWLSEIPAMTYLPEVERDAVWSLRRGFNNDWADPLERPTYRLFANSMRGVNAYRRPAMMLETFAGLMGEDRFTRVMRAFHERWRFRHPQPDDFYTTLVEFGQVEEWNEDGVPVDWAAIWEQAYHRNEWLDFGVARLLNQPAIADPTALDPAGGDNGRFAGLSKERWNVIVEVRRYGGFRVPVEILLVWDEGDPQLELWDGEEEWWRWYDPDSPRQLEAVIVDPRRRLLLDRNWANNSRRATPAKSRAEGVGVRALLWTQQVLHFYGGVG